MVALRIHKSALASAQNGRLNQICAVVKSACIQKTPLVKLREAKMPSRDVVICSPPKTVVETLEENWTDLASANTRALSVYAVFQA